MMCTKALLSFFCGTAAALVSSSASAGPEGGYHAAPGVLKRHEALVAKTQRPPRSMPATKLMEGEEPLVARGRLERFEDGVIWLSLPVSVEQEAALIQSGTKKAASLVEARPGMIFDGRAWVSYSSGMSAELCPTCDRGLLGPDPTLFEHRVGQDVTLSLARDVAGRLRVVGVH